MFSWSRSPGPVGAWRRGPSFAPLIYQILPAGPGKLLNELHTAEGRQLVGRTRVRWWRTADRDRRLDGLCRLFGHGRGPLKREVLEHGPEYGSRRRYRRDSSRCRGSQWPIVPPAVRPVPLSVPFDIRHRISRDEQGEHERRNRDTAQCGTDLISGDGIISSGPSQAAPRSPRFSLDLLLLIRHAAQKKGWEIPKGGIERAKRQEPTNASSARCRYSLASKNTRKGNGSSLPSPTGRRSGRRPGAPQCGDAG